MSLARDYAGTWPRTIDDTKGPPQTPTRSCATKALPKDVLDSVKRLKLSGTTFTENQKTSTPIFPPYPKTRLDPLVGEEHMILQKELGPPIELPENSDFVSSLYSYLASSERIDDFLDETEVYDSTKHRWALPESHETLQEAQMYRPLVKLLKAVFKYFWEGNAARRQVIDTHLTQLPHKEPVPTTNFSSPDISVKARGYSFQLPHRATTTDIGYSNIATCFEVKVTNKRWTLMYQLLQLAGYARQIFIQQPNRRFVRALIITEQNFRLFHFDRSGVQFSHPIDIHGKDGAHTFVRLVLGLGSLDEVDVGLDTSLKWEIENGRKVGGTLTTRGEDNSEVKYTLADVEPTVPCYTVRGRGVICWTVIDPLSGQTLFVRDSWRAQDRLSEDFYLEKARVIAGVAQMLLFEYNRGETKNFRGFDTQSPHSSFRGRISGRIVLNSHGKSIKHFKSPKELLCALRDAIEGHKNLSLKETLHRDIILDNILLGRPGAEKGSRGMLMGLDMAIVNERNASNISADWKTTTGIYQSIMLLRSGDSTICPYPLAHSHLDDLESFIYVLTHIMYEYDHTGTRHAPFQLIKNWTLNPGTPEADSKEAYLGRLIAESDVQKSWPPSCIDLLIEFKSFLYGIHQDRTELSTQPPILREDDLKELAEQLPEHYQAVLSLFDKAIGRIESGNDRIPAPQSVAPGSSSIVLASEASNSHNFSEETRFN
ncbi:hypothetical protein EST38_g4921 [Candolleomyces aberdarensis]|uniref:Fungal-type protein kinase domain-containing protein n=1 Tax=Candolleomyces aberdarensis TaxID=2316362 RepID=A0A4V1Q458_9AGAR|nr:hypothetical protein EST38_g4921 [Candolleomyces aberdarensis]